MLSHLICCNVFGEPRNSTFAPEEPIIRNCLPTPQIWMADYPDVFAKTSDLRRQSGSSIFANGQNIVLYATVFDEHCVPLQDAFIKMWQYNLGDQEKKGAAEDLYTASSISDNLGRFSLYTIMPAKENGEAPKIMLHISHPEFQPFETQIFFSRTRDRFFSKIPKSKQDRLIAQYSGVDAQGIMYYTINLILSGKTHYREY